MSKRFTLRAVMILAILALGVSASASAVTHVVAVVVAGMPGLQDSFWDSEVRVVALAPGQALTVRRQWVALSGGGRADDTAAAPEWAVQPDNAGYAAMLILTGSVCWTEQTPARWNPMPTVLELRPDGDTPYYAYVSQVYSPANDPEFVPVLPGGLEVPAP